MQNFRFFIFNLVGHVLPLCVALISVPVIAQAAGVDRLGALGVVWALVGYFGFLDFGLSRVVTRRVAHAADHGRLKEELLDLRAFFWWWAVPGLVVIGGLVMLARQVFSGVLPPGFLGEEIRASWPWIACSIPATLATNWLRGALEGVHRFARVNLLRSVFGAWTYGAPAIAALVSPTLDAMIAAIVVGRILALAAHAWACLRSDRGILIGAAPRARASARSFFQEGGWITVSNVIGPLLLYSDRFVLAALLPPKAVAWYVTGQEVILRTLVIPAALTGVLFPRFAERSDRRERLAEVPLAELYQGGIRGIAALMLPLCTFAAAAGYDGLRIWLDESFALNAWRVVAIVAVGIYLNAVSHVPFAWLQAVGRAQATARVHLVELPLYAIGLYIAVTEWGIVGAAALWTLRMFLDCLALLYLADSNGAVHVAWPLFGGMAVIGAAGLLVDPSWPPAWRAGLVVFMTLAAIGVASFAVLRADDRAMLLRVAARLRPQHQKS